MKKAIRTFNYNNTSSVWSKHQQRQRKIQRSGLTIPASKIIGVLYLKKEGSAEMSPKVKMKTNLSIREKTEACSPGRKRRQEDKHREHLNGETSKTYKKKHSQNRVEHY